ncbi:MAG: hypothetical protein H6579_07210 [Chitinophagales bacterium]|nr:hypothetical protein [Chitinophagales bacterium]MCP5375425.1 hypothetical protein [Rickettsiaceae bacterium]
MKKSLLILSFSFLLSFSAVANIFNFSESNQAEDYPKLSYSFTKWFNAVDWSGGSNFQPLSENINIVVSTNFVDVYVGGSLEIEYEVLASQIETIEGQSVKAYYFTDGSVGIFYKLSDGTDAAYFEDGGSKQNLVWIDWD